MRKKGFVLMVCLSVLLLLPGLNKAEEEKPDSKKITFGAKLTGGLNYLSVGDWNTSMRSETEQLGDWASSVGAAMEGGFENIHWGMDFEGEMIIYITPRFGITIGSGYIQGSKGPDAHKITITQPTLTNTITFDTKVSAIPIIVGVCYSLPISSKARLVLNGGLGYYFARLSSTYQNEEDGYAVHGWFIEKATGRGLGFQGGAGFEFDIAKNIAFVVEGFGRYAKIGGFEGDWKELNSNGYSYSVNGTSYYYEWLSSETGNWYPTVVISDVEPSGAGVRNVREARVDFSGFMLRVGIRIRF